MEGSCGAICYKTNSVAGLDSNVRMGVQLGMAVLQFGSGAKEQTSSTCSPRFFTIYCQDRLRGTMESGTVKSTSHWTCCINTNVFFHLYWRDALSSSLLETTLDTLQQPIVTKPISTPNAREDS